MDPGLPRENQPSVPGRRSKILAQNKVLGLHMMELWWPFVSEKSFSSPGNLLIYLRKTEVSSTNSQKMAVFLLFLKRNC